MHRGNLSILLVSGGVEIQRGGGGLVKITIQAVKSCYLWFNFHLALTLLPVKDGLSVKVTNFFKRFSTCTYLK